MSVRLQDLRRVVLFVGLVDSGDEALLVLREYLLSLSKTVQTFGWLFTEAGWNLTRAAFEFPSVYQTICISHVLF